MRARLRDPLLWTDALQIAKTAAAAVIAWVLAVEVLSLPQSFLAPWAALLTVHATVYRTLDARASSRPRPRWSACCSPSPSAPPILGVGWAVAGPRRPGGGLIAGTARPLRAESTTAAATALVVLLTGYRRRRSMLLARLADTFIGISVGLVINLASGRRCATVGPRGGSTTSTTGSARCSPTGGRAPRAPGSAPDPDRWVEVTRELDHGIDDAWADVRSARESGRLNLRGHAARRVRDARDLGDVLVGIEQAVAERAAWRGR